MPADEKRELPKCPGCWSVDPGNRVNGCENVWHVDVVGDAPEPSREAVPSAVRGALESAKAALYDGIYSGKGVTEGYARKVIEEINLGLKRMDAEFAEARHFAAFARTEVARALREDATARVRKDCPACDNGVASVEPVPLCEPGESGEPVVVGYEAEAIECEYCGRPSQSLRALADEWEGGDAS